MTLQGGEGATEQESTLASHTVKCIPLLIIGMGLIFVNKLGFMQVSALILQRFQHLLAVNESVIWHMYYTTLLLCSVCA